MNLALKKLTKVDMPYNPNKQKNEFRICLS